MLENHRNDTLSAILLLKKFRKIVIIVVEDENFTIFLSLGISIKVSFLGFSTMEISFFEVRMQFEIEKVSILCQ